MGTYFRPVQLHSGQGPHAARAALMWTTGPPSCCLLPSALGTATISYCTGDVGSPSLPPYWAHMCSCLPTALSTQVLPPSTTLDMWVLSLHPCSTGHICLSHTFSSLGMGSSVALCCAGAPCHRFS